MLQRIQTVFLLLVVLLMLLTLIFPMWVYHAPDSDKGIMLTAFYLVTNNGLEQASKEYFPYILIGCFAILSVIIGIIEISRFKNRLLQIKLSALNSLLIFCTLGLSFWLGKGVMESEQIQNSWTYGIGSFLPVGAMLFNVLANRFIRKDERLVRSVDRIR
ncbi:DUF4293 domain-containing protein [Fulvivirga sediminis]|uniref:DUF4293 domain-containing protein n=1 Tax=Fulvivirga sediminis TaxID=2803949 RepID=A0A937F593_9BACT|nr:DUF4293 domain-containing protein [Fulvivirga sediminis]MBL3654570.1 DUF4293 domain-containing protein [Fulvivirga sediminis]